MERNETGRHQAKGSATTIYAATFGTVEQTGRRWSHVSEYLGAAAQTCRPAKVEQWRHIQQKRLRRGAFEKVVESLEEHLEPTDTLKELSPIRNAHRYLSNRRECLDYPRALKLELPIGSGIIESGHRHVLQARLKKAGAAWLQPHADSIAHLQVLRANQ